MDKINASVAQQRRRIHHRLAGIVVGGSHISAQHGNTYRIGGNTLCRFLALSDEGRFFHPVAYGIAAHGQLGKYNQTRAGLASTLREFDDPLAVAIEISHRRIDLSQSYLHGF